jgi:hypothetical protein
MKCPKCAGAVEEGWRVCPRCATAINQSSSGAGKASAPGDSGDPIARATDLLKVGKLDEAIHSLAAAAVDDLDDTSVTAMIRELKTVKVLLGASKTVIGLTDMRRTLSELAAVQERHPDTPIVLDCRRELETKICQLEECLKQARRVAAEDELLAAQYIGQAKDAGASAADLSPIEQQIKAAAAAVRVRHFRKWGFVAVGTVALVVVVALAMAARDRSSAGRALSAAGHIHDGNYAAAGQDTRLMANSPMSGDVRVSLANKLLTDSPFSNDSDAGDAIRRSIDGDPERFVMLYWGHSTENWFIHVKEASLPTAKDPARAAGLFGLGANYPKWQSDSGSVDAAAEAGDVNKLKQFAQEYPWDKRIATLLEETCRRFVQKEIHASNPDFVPVMDVRRGQTLEIRAEGTWSYNGRKSQCTCDANGKGDIYWLKQVWVGYLEARIGGGPALKVGSDYTLEVQQDGQLQMRMHDEGPPSNWNDNTGSVIVHVKVR